MKHLTVVLSFMVAAALVWWTLASDRGYAEAEAARRNAYMSILIEEISAQSAALFTTLPADQETAHYAAFISKVGLDKLSAMKRYAPDLDTFFTHHMQIIYLKHDGQQIQLMAAGSILASIRPK